LSFYKNAENAIPPIKFNDFVSPAVDSNAPILKNTSSMWAKQQFHEFAQPFLVSIVTKRTQ
jgi:hypothetical protein